MTEYTASDLIAKHNELNDYIEAQQKALDEVLKPYKDGVKSIETMLLDMMQQQGVQNFKTEEHGTAYQRTTRSITVDNRESFLNFIAAENTWDMLKVAALKEPVETWLEKNNGVLPEGLKSEQFTKVVIRRS